MPSCDLRVISVEKQTRDEALQELELGHGLFPDFLLPSPGSNVAKMRDRTVAGSLVATSPLFPPAMPFCSGSKARRDARLLGLLTQNKSVSAALFPPEVLVCCFFFFFCFDKAGQIKRCSLVGARANCLPLFEQEALFFSAAVIICDCWRSALPSASSFEEAKQKQEF